MNGSLAAWDRYWNDLTESRGTALWDAGPEAGMTPCLPLLTAHCAPGLPVLDLGCGDGTTTRYLASRFPRVIGADLSAAAIELARRTTDPGLVDYRQLDILDASAVAGFRAEVGEVNVFVRGVLHQIGESHWPQAMASLAELVGAQGRFVLVEPGLEAYRILRSLMDDPDRPSARVAEVFDRGIAVGLRSDDFEAHLAAAGLTALEQGQMALPIAEAGPDGTALTMPMRFLAARRLEEAAVAG